MSQDKVVTVLLENAHGPRFALIAKTSTYCGDELRDGGEKERIMRLPGPWFAIYISVFRDMRPNLARAV